MTTSRSARVVAAVLALALAACGGPSAGAKRAQSLIDQGDYQAAYEVTGTELTRTPRDRHLWRLRIRAALGLGDARGAVAHYAELRTARGGDDLGALRTMALTTLWQALSSPSAAIRLQAVQAIEDVRVVELAEQVGERMGDDDDQVAAAAAVAVLRDYPQAPRAATALLTSDDPVARAIVVAGIGRKIVPIGGQIGQLAAEDVRAATKDADATVRRVAILALAPLEDGADTARFLALAGDPVGEVRAAALRALSRGKRGELGAAIRTGLQDAYLGARHAAVELATAVKDRAAIAPLLEGADLSLAVRVAVALAVIDRTPAPAAAAVLDRALAAGDDWPLRAAALNAAVAALGRDPAVVRARAALRDPRVEVQIAAARVLIAATTGAGADRDAAVATLVAAASAAAADVRIEAASDLARLGDPRGLDILGALAGGAPLPGADPQASEPPSPEVRRRAVDAHAWARHVSPGLVSALADEPAVRVAAAATLMRLARDLDD